MKNKTLCLVANLNALGCGLVCLYCVYAQKLTDAFLFFGLFLLSRMVAIVYKNK